MARQASWRPDMYPDSGLCLLCQSAPETLEDVFPCPIPAAATTRESLSRRLLEVLREAISGSAEGVRELGHYALSLGLSPNNFLVSGEPVIKAGSRSPSRWQSPRFRAP